MINMEDYGCDNWMVLTGDFYRHRVEEEGIGVSLESLSDVTIAIVDNNKPSFVRLSFESVKKGKPNVTATTIEAKAYNLGSKLPDGWIIMGRSYESPNKAFSCEPEEGALQGHQTFYAGCEHAKDLCEAGHANARIPCMYDLSTIWETVIKRGRNQHAKLNTDSSPQGGYWSSSCSSSGRFEIQAMDSEESQYSGRKGYEDAHVRVIRDEPGLIIGSKYYLPEM